MPLHATTSRSGFILVMTLMLLAIAAVALAASARSSMGLAVGAVHARQDLQRKWGNHSIRHTALELAPPLLEEANIKANKPVVRISTGFSLSDQTYTITVSDEQAKVNINALLQHQGRDTARTFARKQFTDNMGSSEIYLPTNHGVSHVSPAAAEKEEEEEEVELDRKIVSINHLLPGFDPDSIDSLEGYPLTGLTCWGDGRINLKRASDEQVKEITAPLLGTIQISRLRGALATSGEDALDQALAGIGLPDKTVPEVMRRLTLESSCYSVWLTTDTGKRRWHEFSVIELDPGEIIQQDDPDTDKSTNLADLEPPLRTQANTTADQLKSMAALPEQLQADTIPETYPRLRVYQW